jgi:hypothetical protein
VNKLTFYEQVGIVIPGSVFLFGLLLFCPVLQTVLTKDGVSFGELGIFVLLSYAAGHLIAAVGNATESFLWRLVGGMPSDWVTRTQTSLLSAPQIDLLEKKIHIRLGNGGQHTRTRPQNLVADLAADLCRHCEKWEGGKDRYIQWKLWPESRTCRSHVWSRVRIKRRAASRSPRRHARVAWAALQGRGPSRSSD